MDFKKQTPIIVQSFHYDLQDEPKPKDEVNISIRQAVATAPDGSEDTGKDGGYYEVAVIFDVTPQEGIEVSGTISQIVQLMGYYGDGQDLEPDDYRLLTRPLVEDIETLTYEVTQVTLDEPINMEFEPNF